MVADVDPPTVTERVPHVLVPEVSQSVMVALPGAVAPRTTFVPDIPTETALLLELLDII